MRNGIIMAGAAAALAFTAPVLAQPGKGGGNGGGGGNKGGAPAQVQRGNGGGGGQKVERGGGGVPRQQQQQQARGPERREIRVERQQPRAERAPVRESRSDRGSDKRDARSVEQREGRSVQQRDARSVQQRDARSVQQREGRSNGRSDRDVQIAQDRGRAEIADRRPADRTNLRTVSYEQRRQLFSSPAFRTTGLVDGCPPGLAAKGNGCLPPGQARKLVGAAIPVTLGSALLPPLYRNWYPDNDDYFYRTQDDYVYRIDRDRNLVDAYWPLAAQWNGAYYVGATYPQEYLGYYNVPVQYQPWYADDGDNYYRYGDGAIYQVDRNGGVIDSIVSLLAGGVGVGQPLPDGYDVYNVPYSYRDRYVDSADNLYRYNDGYIYQVDPTTRLVESIVETLI